MRTHTQTLGIIRFIQMCAAIEQTFQRTQPGLCQHNVVVSISAPTVEYDVCGETRVSDARHLHQNEILSEKIARKRSQRTLAPPSTTNQMPESCLLIYRWHGLSPKINKDIINNNLHKLPASDAIRTKSRAVPVPRQKWASSCGRSYKQWRGTIARKTK